MRKRRYTIAYRSLRGYPQNRKHIHFHIIQIKHKYVAFFSIIVVYRANLRLKISKHFLILIINSIRSYSYKVPHQLLIRKKLDQCGLRRVKQIEASYLETILYYHFFLKKSRQQKYLNADSLYFLYVKLLCINTIC